MLQQWEEVSFEEFFRSRSGLIKRWSLCRRSLSTAREHLKNQLEDISLFSQLLDVADRLQVQCSRLPNGQELFAMAQVPSQLAMTRMWQSPSSLLLGQICEEQGQYDEAIEQYSKVAVPLAYGARVRGNWLATLAGIERKIEGQPAAEDPPAEAPSDEPAAEDQSAEAPSIKNRPPRPRLRKRRPTNRPPRPRLRKRRPTNLLPRTRLRKRRPTNRPPRTRLRKRRPMNRPPRTRLRKRRPTNRPPRTRLRKRRPMRATSSRQLERKAYRLSGP